LVALLVPNVRQTSWVSEQMMRMRVRMRPRPVLLPGGDLVQAGPGGDVVAWQSPLHQPLHPQPQPVQLVVDLQGGHGSRAVGLALRRLRGVVVVVVVVVVVAGTGPRAAQPRRPTPGRPRLVLGRPVVGVLAGVHGLEEAQVLLVAVERQHVAGVVRPAAGPLVVVVVVAAHGVLRVLQQGVHPLAVLVHVQEREMQSHTPARGNESYGRNSYLMYTLPLNMYIYIYI